MKIKPFVSIIIPALNEEKYIRKCLNSLVNLNYPKSKYEIILVDNGSTDKTLEIAKKINIKIFIKPKITIAALRNFGAKQTKGEVFAFIDSDCEVDKEFLNFAIEDLFEKGFSATGSHHVVPDDNRLAKIWYSRKKTKSNQDWISAGNFIIKRKKFEEVGGFNEKLITGEDSDICQRIGKNNLTVNESIKSIHHGNFKTFGQFFKKELWYGIGRSKIKKLDNLSVLNIIYFLSIMGEIIGIIFLNTLLVSVFAIIILGIPLLLSIRSAIKNPKYFFTYFILYLLFSIANSLSIIFKIFYKK